MQMQKRHRQYLTGVERLEHRRSRQLVHQALKYNRIVKPDACEACGTSGDYIQAWHITYGQSYSKLNIMWLCHPCLEGKRQQRVQEYIERVMPAYEPVKPLVRVGRYLCLPCRAGEHKACLLDGDEHDALAPVCRCECRVKSRG